MFAEFSVVYQKFASVLGCCLLLLVSATLTGQKAGLSMADGLSQGMVMDVLQDSKGYLWIGTLDGLNRYNGYDIEVFTFSPDLDYSLSDYRITTLYEDSRGWLWVGTYAGGVNVFHPESERFYHINNSGESGLQSNHIAAFSEDASGHIWVGHLSGLVRVMQPGNWEFDSFEKSDIGGKIEIHSVFSGEIVKEILIRRDTAWIASGDELYFTDASQPYELFLHENRLPSNISPQLREIQGVFFDRYNNLWIRGPHSLSTITRDTVLYCDFGISHIYGNMGFCIDKNGDFIVGGTSVTRYRPQPDGRLELIEKLIYPSEKYYYNHLFIDRTGLLWMSTSGYGLRKFNFTRSRFGHLLEGESVRFIYEDNKNRIFVKENFGLLMVDLESHQLIQPDDIPKELLVSNNVVQDGHGVYWFNPRGEDNKNELISWDPSLREMNRYFHDYSTHFLSFMMVDKKGNIWMMAEEENYLIRLNQQSKVFTSFDLGKLLEGADESIFVTSMIHKSGPVYWLATSHGLLRIVIEDEKIGDWELFRHDRKDRNSLGSNYIFHIGFDEKDQNLLWLGTRGGGLNKMNIVSRTIERITTADGLPNNVVYSVLPHNGKLWVSTNRGLAQYDPETGIFSNYSPEEGLQDFEFNFASYARLSDGRLVFGGVNGINIFKPEDIELNKTAPLVDFTKIKVNNHRIQHWAGINSPFHLNYRENTLSFSFASLDFLDPSMNKYKYRLDGVDRDWINSGSNREVTYANLTPGSYNFRVMGTNNSGLWSDDEAVFAFVIDPPWWRTNTAYVVYLVLLVAVGFFILRFQKRRMEMRNQLKLEKMEKERLEELDRLKSVFFSNITHELKSPVTLILEPIRQAMTKLEDRKVIKNLKIAERNSHQLLLMIDQLLELSRLEAREMRLNTSPGNLKEDFERAVLGFVSFAKKGEIDLRVSLPGQNVFAEYDISAIQKIVNNLLSNAIKFTRPGGSVFVSLELGESASKQYHNTIIKVKDTGIGMGEEEQNRVFERFYQANSGRESSGTGIGLPIARELAELMGGTLSVNSIEEKGSLFVAEFPLKRADESTSYREEISDLKSPDLPAPGGDVGQAEVGHPGPVGSNTHKRESGEKVILIVDDNADVRKFLSSIFSNDYSTYEAANGAEGLKIARNYIPDLIISDWVMPNSSGIEFCRAAKSDELTGHIPFILVTAKTSMDNKLEGLQAMADAYISKPFHSGEILALAESMMGNREIALKKMREETLDQYGLMGYADETIGKERIAASDQFLLKVNEFLRENLTNENLKVEELATYLLISRMQLHRKLTAVSGVTTSEYIRNYRLKHGYFLLKNTKLNVGEIAAMVGMSNRTYFSRTFKKKFGLSPSGLRRKKKK